MRTSSLLLLALVGLACLALTVDAAQSATSLESAAAVRGGQRVSSLLRSVQSASAAAGKPKSKAAAKKGGRGPVGKAPKGKGKARPGQATGKKSNQVTADQKGLPASSPKMAPVPKVGSGTIAYTYSQKTGAFSGGGINARGYSGRAAGLNNPAMQHVRAPCQSGAQCDRVAAGPIPRGQYTVSSVVPSGHKRGAWTAVLTPFSSNSMMGRDGFLVHGANRRDTATNKVSSTGCIILPMADRQKLKRGAVLTVTQ